MRCRGRRDGLHRYVVATAWADRTPHPVRQQQQDRERRQERRHDDDGADGGDEHVRRVPQVRRQTAGGGPLGCQQVLGALLTDPHRQGGEGAAVAQQVQASGDLLDLALDPVQLLLHRDGVGHAGGVLQQAQVEALLGLEVALP